MVTTGLVGKVAVVTGASRGIGRAVALRRARDGAAVVVNYAGNAEAARSVVAEVEALGGRAVAVQADVGRVPDVARLFDETIRHQGKIDILVNNVGVYFTRPLAEVSEEEFDRNFAVNVNGTFFCCQQAAQRMADGGRIVNFSSSTTALMLPLHSAYVATNGAVEQVSHVLDRELGPRGITFNVVSPGPTDTEVFSSDKPEEDKRRFAQMAAPGRSTAAPATFAKFWARTPTRPTGRSPAQHGTDIASARSPASARGSAPRSRARNRYPSRNRRPFTSARRPGCVLPTCVSGPSGKWFASTAG